MVHGCGLLIFRFRKPKLRTNGGPWSWRVPYVRTVKTKSGATAVQVVWSSQRGSRKIEHLGSAHDEAEMEVLKAAGRQRIAAGQAELDLGLESAGGGPLPITSSRVGCLLDALERGPDLAHDSEMRAH